MWPIFWPFLLQISKCIKISCTFQINRLHHKLTVHEKGLLQKYCFQNCFIGTISFYIFNTLVVLSCLTWWIINQWTKNKWECTLYPYKICISIRNSLWELDANVTNAAFSHILTDFQWTCTNYQTKNSWIQHQHFSVDVFDVISIKCR